VEYISIFQNIAEYMDLPISAKSTIAVDFSFDGQFFASTHGDHTVKITRFATGKVVKTLVGHPRTPWTVKFHPKENFIVASGCLGFQVRIWNTRLETCTHLVQYSHAIISISFHPAGKLLAIATGASLFLWDYETSAQSVEILSHSQALRCVCFLPCGTKVLIGATNPQRETPPVNILNAILASTRRENSYELQLWNFNPQALEGTSASPCLSQVCRVVERALLYNDGGIDISRCGRYLYVCAEFWVPSCPMRRTSQKQAPIPKNLASSQAIIQGAPMQQHRDSTSSQTCHKEAQAAGKFIFKPWPNSKLKQENHFGKGMPDLTKATYNNFPVLKAYQDDRAADNSEVFTDSKVSVTVPTDNLWITPPPLNKKRTQDYESSAETESDNNQKHGEMDLTVALTRIRTRRRPRMSDEVNLAPPFSWAQNKVDPLEKEIPSLADVELEGDPSMGTYKALMVQISLDCWDRLSKEEIKQWKHVKNARTLSGVPAKGVTSLKVSPTGHHLLLGCGVRDQLRQQSPDQPGQANRYPVTFVYDVPFFSLVGERYEEEDDVNIAKFHPSPGEGYIYGTKQGRIRIMKFKSCIK